MPADLGARLEHLNQKFRFHNICIWEIGVSQVCCLRNSKKHSKKVQIPTKKLHNKQLFPEGQLEGTAAELRSQGHPLFRFPMRSYDMYLLGHISDKELTSITVSSEQEKTGS